ncbi:Importin subunit alpha-4 [Cucumispora dikerogammari]|nr:Importin subunit alpha-4 [Cucumispora dikerogammari]
MADDRFFMYKDLDPQSRQRKRMEDFNTHISNIRQGKLEKLRKFKPVYDTETIKNLRIIKTKLVSTDLREISEGVVEFRHLLSENMSPPIRAVVDSGVVPRFVELLSRKCVVYSNGDEKLIRNIRLETAWVITNIASGSSEQTQIVVESGAAPLLIDMLSENDEEIIDQAVWALGNISGESEKMRNMIIFSNATEVVAKIGLILSGEKKYIKILRNITWLLSNLNRGQNPPPPIESVLLSIPLLEKLVVHEDADVLTDAIWTVDYISEFSVDCANAIFSSAIFEQILIKLHTISANNIISAAIYPLVKFPGAVASSSPEFIPFLIEKGMITLIYQIFFNLSAASKVTRTRKEICWSFSKLTKGSPLCLEYFYNMEIMRLLIIALELDKSIAQEAVVALNNLVQNDALVMKYINQYENRELFRGLMGLLDSFDDNPKIIVCVLMTLGKILKLFETLNRASEVGSWIQELDLNRKLLYLVGSDNENVRGVSQGLLNCFFN